MEGYKRPLPLPRAHEFRSTTKYLKGAVMKKLRFFGSKQMHKVAREDMPARHTAIFIQQLAAPPPVLGRSGDGDDIVRLEIKLFRYCRRVVVKGAH